MTPLSVSYSSHILSVKIVSLIETAINTTKQCVCIWWGQGDSNPPTYRLKAEYSTIELYPLWFTTLITSHNRLSF